MPSFDIVSEINQHELNNALDQTNRDIGTRYDFKGVNAKLTLQDKLIEFEAETEFHINQMLEIFYQRCSKRSLELGHFKPGPIENRGKRSIMHLSVQQGIDKEPAKKLIKFIKEQNFKVQAAIQGEQIRITGKKKDDLQQVIAALKGTKLEQPLQFVNFRE